MAAPSLLFKDLGTNPPIRRHSSYFLHGRALILEGITPDGWYHPNNNAESTINVIIRGTDPLNQATLPHTEPVAKSELIRAYELLTSPHALRDRTKRSDVYIREDSQVDNELLRPMFTAAQATFISEAKERGEDPSSIQFSLKPHQRDGVGMMRRFENGIYRGCLLGDDMGLGKTVQILALYLVNPIQGPMLVVAPASIVDNWIQEIKRFLNLSEPDVFVYRGSNINKVHPGVLERAKIVLTSFNRLRTEEASLETTVQNFQALRQAPGAEHRPNPKNTRNRSFPPIRISTVRPQISLLATEWGRIVLDEGHAIRNRKTITFRAASRLRAKTRILVTGTPFANEYSDVQSAFDFLRISPFDKLSFFRPYFLNKKVNRKNDRIQIPVLPHMRNAVLHQAMQAIMVRRMKTDQFEGQLVIEIPAPEHVAVYVQLDQGLKYPDVKCYNGPTMPHGVNTFRTLKNIGLFFSWVRSGGRAPPTNSLLYQLSANEFVPFSEQSTQYESRFQWCNSLRALKQKQKEREKEKRRRRTKSRPQKEITDSLPSVTTMLQGSMYAAHWAAPRARYAFQDNGEDDPSAAHEDLDVLERQELRLAGRGLNEQHHRRQEFLKEAAIGNFWKSSKTEETVRLVQQRLQEDPGKIIVFCFSVVVLDLLAIGLARCGTSYIRYDGSVPKEKRFPLINDFQASSGKRVILITSGLGSVGLNLCAATTVIVVCPEWSPAKDDQLIGRAYRMGQKKRIKVYRIIAEHSMDQLVQEVQELKNEKRNALLDLLRTDGISKKEAARRSKTLATVGSLMGFGLEEFEQHMAQERVDRKNDEDDGDDVSDNETTSIELSSDDSDEETPEQPTSAESDVEMTDLDEQ